MWLITRYGLFSAVSARKGEGGKSGEIDPDRIMVRARVKAHLDKIIKLYPEELAGAKVIESTHNDYRYRIFVPKDKWAAVVASLVLDTDYDNFKNAAGRTWPREDYGYISFLHDVWGKGLRMQPLRGTNSTTKKGGDYRGQMEFDRYDNYIERTSTGWFPDVHRTTSALTGPIVSKGPPLDRLPPEPTDEDYRFLDRDDDEKRQFLAGPREAPRKPEPPPPPLDTVSRVEGPEPQDGEKVYAVIDPAKGEVIGVIWWPKYWRDRRIAYEEAIANGSLPEVRDAVIEYRAYIEFKGKNIPTYNWKKDEVL